MIVFDLQCRGARHIFEGWFSSSEDFEDQRDKGLLVCPVCGDASVEKAVMAPAVAPKGNQRTAVANAPSAPAPAPTGQVTMTAGDREKAMRLMQALAHAQAEVLANSEWVGQRFADRARAMHYGEEDARPIHGEVEADEARQLIGEGVEVSPLIFPVIPPEAQN